MWRVQRTHLNKGPDKKYTSKVFDLTFIDSILKEYVANPSPEVTASYPSKLVFAWFDSTIKKGWKNPIREDDLHDMSPEFSCRNVMTTWTKYWQNQAKKKTKGERLSILPTLILTFLIPFLEAGVNRVFSILCQQVFIELFLAPK